MIDNKMNKRKHYLLRKQVITIVLCITACTSLQAQKEQIRPNHENLPYYFGLTFGYSNMNLHTSKDPRFLQYDSVLWVEPGASGGVSLGLLTTLRLSKRFQLRAGPELIVGGAKFFTYGVKYPNIGAEESPETKKTLPSTIMSFPFQLKFNSDRIHNFQVYMLGGLKYDIDLASNSNARNAEGLVKLNKNDYGYEAGLGFSFYLPFVTLSPEIKLSNGLSNIHSRDPDLKFSNVMGNLQSRMVIFSINIEE